jgi:hypothetical protein
MQSDDEIKELRGIIQEMKETMEGSKGRSPDSSSYPDSRTTNVHETATTPGVEEGNPSISQKTDKITPVLRDTFANQYIGNSHGQSAVPFETVGHLYWAQKYPGAN